MRYYEPILLSSSLVAPERALIFVHKNIPPSQEAKVVIGDSAFILLFFGPFEEKNTVLSDAMTSMNEYCVCPSVQPTRCMLKRPLFRSALKPAASP